MERFQWCIIYFLQSYNKYGVIFFHNLLNIRIFLYTFDILQKMTLSAT